MSDISYGVPVAARTGLLGFLAEALARLADRRLIAPATILVILLTATNIVIARNLPVGGAPLPMPFAIAAAARLVALLVFAVSVLRILAGSPRPAWKPDGAFWLYGATILFGFGVAIAARLLLRADGDPLRDAAAGLVVNFVSAPFAAWFAAIAVERPLAWRAGRWMRAFGCWLPALLLWSILILLPLGQLHAGIDRFLIGGSAGQWFWPLALGDGPLSTLLFFLSLAFAATAYRHVARA